MQPFKITRKQRGKLTVIINDWDSGKPEFRLVVPCVLVDPSEFLKIAEAVQKDQIAYDDAQVAAGYEDPPPYHVGLVDLVVGAHNKEGIDEIEKLGLKVERQRYSADGKLSPHAPPETIDPAVFLAEVRHFKFWEVAIRDAYVLKLQGKAKN
jgi:hypothetical protein